MSFATGRGRGGEKPQDSQNFVLNSLPTTKLLILFCYLVEDFVYNIFFIFLSHFISLAGSI